MKIISIENFLTPDPTNLIFSKVNTATGEVLPMPPEEWAQIFLAFELSKGVPSQLVNLFEVAKGAMLYGYFFYPLYTFGLEQVYRVADEAIVVKCETIKASAKDRKTFETRINCLVRAGVLTAKGAGEWHIIRKIRNEASHAREQTVLPPGATALVLNHLVEKINALFP
jgi:hypothetical protein